MKLVFEDTKQRQIKGQETVSFFVDVSSVCLIEIKAMAKGEKQLGGSDDEDLKVEIDRQKFPTISGQPRYFDGPAAFPGGKLHGLSKSVFFFLPLVNGLHEISLTPDVSAVLEKIQVFQISSGEEVSLSNIVVEDGDRRPWLTFVFLDVLLKGFSLDLLLRRRFVDSDDVKVIIDDVVKRNNRSILHKLWYFVASFNEAQSGNFEANFTSGLHYVELWADRTPILNKITFKDLNSSPIESRDSTEIIKDKIRFKAREYGFDEEMMLRMAKKESQFNPKAVSGKDAKGLFQLTSIALDQVRGEGYTVSDVFDVDQNINAGLIYFRWLYRYYKGDNEQLIKTVAAWNCGLRDVPRGQLLDFNGLHEETKVFIRFVLGR